MQLINSKKWKKKVNRIFKTFAEKNLILMYHRVAPKGIDPWSLAVTKEHFEGHLKILKKHTQPLTLMELYDAHQQGKVPERAVTITFDDGYANNLYTAKPLLEKYQIPATVFVTTGYTEKKVEYWWDALDNIFFSPIQLPEKLSLQIKGKSFEYNLKEAINYTEKEKLQDYSSRAWIAKPGSRMALYFAVWQKLHPLAEGERQKILDQIICWANYNPKPRRNHRPMTREELINLETNSVVSIGAHTVNHPPLSALPVSLQKQEIEESKAYLEKILDHPVNTFAYPFGDFSKQTSTLIKNAGFACACSTDEETVWKRSDAYQLPRYNIIDWNARDFEKKLLKWLKNE